MGEGYDSELIDMVVSKSIIKQLVAQENQRIHCYYYHDRRRLKIPTLEKILSELERDEDDLSLNEILSLLIDGTKDIDLKTQINNPRPLAGLFVLANLLQQKNMEQSSLLIKDFLNTYFRYMISYNRESRKEIIKALMNKYEVETKDVTQKLIKKLD